jgi:hypothetical protein
VGCTLERGVDDPDALIARYVLTREWADALVRAGSGPVAVVQRFVRDVVERTGAVEYDVRAYFEGNLSWSAIGRHALQSCQAIAEARARRVR